MRLSPSSPILNPVIREACLRTLAFVDHSKTAEYYVEWHTRLAPANNIVFRHQMPYLGHGLFILDPESAEIESKMTLEEAYAILEEKYLKMVELGFGAHVRRWWLWEHSQGAA